LGEKENPYTGKVGDDSSVVTGAPVSPSTTSTGPVEGPGVAAGTVVMTLVPAGFTNALLPWSVRMELIEIVESGDTVPLARYLAGQTAQEPHPFASVPNRMLVPSGSGALVDVAPPESVDTKAKKRSLVTVVVPSVACTRTGPPGPPVAVPDSRPAASRLIPVGSVPDKTLQVTGPAAPTATTWWL